MTVITENATAKRTQGLSARAHALLTKLNLYYAGAALLVLLNIYLLIQIAFAWNAAHSRDEKALAQQRVAMKAAEIAEKPLEGLDGKLAKATEQADSFYQKRLPYAYSQVAGELGVLKNKYNVKLIRIQYAQAPVLATGTGALTEVRMDASLSGDYRQLVLFMNALERDKMFFLIRGVTLTGQQSGTVGLRLALTTYLRASIGKEVSDKAVTSDNATPDGGVPR